MCFHVYFMILNPDVNVFLQQSVNISFLKYFHFLQILFMIQRRAFKYLLKPRSIPGTTQTWASLSLWVSSSSPSHRWEHRRKKTRVHTRDSGLTRHSTFPGQLASPGSALLCVCGWVCAETFWSYLPLLPINSSLSEPPTPEQLSRRAYQPQEYSPLPMPFADAWC